MSNFNYYLNKSAFLGSAEELSPWTNFRANFMLFRELVITSQANGAKYWLS